IAKVREGRLPIYRALTPTAEERMIREFILQMKLGRVETSYFRDKFGIDVRSRFAIPFGKLEEEGFLRLEDDGLSLSRDGLLQVDRLLHEFFLPEHRNARAT